MKQMVITVTLMEALIMGINILKSAGIEAPEIESGAILCLAINRDKTFLYAHGEYELSDKEKAKFEELICNRARGIPFQYISGHQEFMSLDFDVCPGVLIPRPDTEVLVETVIHYVSMPKRDKIYILDVGTGSGCIAVSLAYYLKESFVTAVDVSDTALDIARLNAVKAGVEDRIVFKKSNIFDGLDKYDGDACCFDIIVSNPPYIPSKEIHELQPEVKDHEPWIALDGGADGLEFFRAIIRDSVKFLKSGGLLALEIGYNQSKNVCELMQEFYHDICIFKDLAGIERVVVGRLNEE